MHSLCLALPIFFGIICRLVLALSCVLRNPDTSVYIFVGILMVFLYVYQFLIPKIIEGGAERIKSKPPPIVYYLIAIVVPEWGGKFALDKITHDWHLKD